MKLNKVILFGLMILGAQAQASDIQLNGFGSAYGGKSLTDQIYNSSFSDSEIQFGTLSRFGLNVGAHLTDTVQFSGQFVVDGSQISGPFTTASWNLLVNWAFLTYTPVVGLDLKVGRQLYPAWLASEFINVGFLQPFRVMYAGLFNIAPFKAFDGGSVNYTHDVGPVGKLTWTVYGGRATQSGGGSNAAGQFPTNSIVDANNLLGASLSLKGDGYRLRANASRFKVSLNTVVNPVVSAQGQVATIFNNTAAGNLSQYTFGGTWDKYNIVVWAEYGMGSSDDAVPSGLLKSYRGGYALLGYRIDKFMPRYMYSTTDWSQAGIASLGKGVGHTFGLNYQANEQAVVKLDFQIDQTVDGYTPAFINRQAGSTQTSAQSITAGVDFIF